VSEPGRGSPAPAPRAGVLRVASYNVRDLKDDSAAAARVVRRICPDVLCLQEVPRHPLSGHRVADFASACGMLFGGGHQGGGGTTVLTAIRVEAAFCAHRALPVQRWQRSRGYAVARVALPGRLPVLVVSAHLGLDAAERVRHIRGMLDGIRAPGSFATGPMPTGPLFTGPLVIGADLNEGEEGLAWRALTVFAGGLRAVTGPSPTFSARRPRVRIDAVFATADLQQVQAPPLDLPAADLAAASDHLPVWVDLALP